VNTLAAYWVTTSCLLVFLAVTLAVIWDQGRLRRRQDELTARINRIDPPLPRGRHRIGNGSTAVQS
jgi:hypothetical protein